MDGSGMPMTTVPALSSDPGAAATIYLDFDGHSESQWGPWGWGAAAAGPASVIGETIGAITGGLIPIPLIGPVSAAVGGILSSELLEAPMTPVFDFDGDPSTFSVAEQGVICEIWERVSEDFAPFDVNVTTVNPGSFDNGQALRVSIGGSGNWLQDPPLGIALPGSFNNFLDNSVYVFSNNLAGNTVNNAPGIAKTVSHEIGHAMGLMHKSDGTTARASIMQQGTLNSGTRSTWTNGTADQGELDLYNILRTLSGQATLSNPQDDMAVIASADNGFGFRSDDHGNTLPAATSLVGLGQEFTYVSPSWGVAGTSGIIETTSDVDFFEFYLEKAGWIEAQVLVADGNPGDQGTLAGGTGNSGVANLDAVLELRDSNGWLVAPAAAPTNSLNAAVKAELPRGKYYLRVSSQGAFGDVGQYTVRVTDASGPQVEQLHVTSPSTLRVDFDEPIDPATFGVFQDSITLSDLHGPVPVTGVGSLSGRSYLIHFDRANFADAGRTGLQLRLGTAITDLAGNPMNGDGDENNGEPLADEFYWNDFEAPEVAMIHHRPGELVVTFNERVLSGSIAPGTFELTTLGGQSMLLFSVTPQGPNGNQFVLDVGAFPAGGFQLTIHPDVTDYFDTPMASSYTYTHVDNSGPRVTAVIPSRLMDHVTVVFDEAPNPATFIDPVTQTSPDIGIRDSNGVHVPITRVEPTPTSEGRSFNVFFAGSTGTHQISVGPAIYDLFGNRMDLPYFDKFEMSAVGGEAPIKRRPFIRPGVRPILPPIEEPLDGPIEGGLPGDALVKPPLPGDGVIEPILPGDGPIVRLPPVDDRLPPLLLSIADQVGERSTRKSTDPMSSVDTLSTKEFNASESFSKFADEVMQSDLWRWK